MANSNGGLLLKTCLLFVGVFGSTEQIVEIADGCTTIGMGAKLSITLLLVVYLF